MSQNKEKLESELYQQYQQAIDNLENGDVETGKATLKKLMENPAIINQDDKRILYGIYMSLAETLAQSPEVAHKCEALYYYNLSNSIIENCWQIFRKMAILFRQIGMLPKALNTIIKAFQLCTQTLMHSSILYQICSICFLMNETAQFFKYFNLIPNHDTFKSKFKELQDYINSGIVTNFVEELLQEKSSIPEKLKLIPQNQIESEFFNQQNEYDLKIDQYDLKKFFKKIKNMLQVNVNVEPKKQDFFLNDKSLLTNTSIVISQKLTIQKKKNATKDLVKENQAPVKQSERQKSKKSKQQQQDQQQFVLDSTLTTSFKSLIELTKEIEGSSIFETNSNNKIILEQQEKHECPVAKFLIQRMSKKKYLTIIAVLNDLIILLLQEFQSSLDDEQSYKDALRGLINCVVWAQYSTNHFTDNPIIKLKLLELSYEELNLRCKLKKAKSPEQHNKIKNYNRFISNLKLELLQTDIRQTLQDETEIKNYLNRYYRLMVHIHCDINFFIGRIAQQSADELNDRDLIEFVKEKTKAAKVQISTSSPHQSQQINQIICQWEMKEQKLEDNEKIRSQINFVVDYLKQNQSCEIVKRFATICLNQFYFAQSKEDLKIINKFIEPMLLELQNVQQVDTSLSFLFLKFALIYQQMELESSGFVSHFLRTLVFEVNCSKKPLLLIEILKLQNLNIIKLFSLMDIALVTKEFVNLKQELKEKSQQLIKYFKTNIQSDTELNYYLLHLLDLKAQQTPRFKVTKRTIQIEVPKCDTKFESPQSFSSASEDDLSQAEQFSKQYMDIGLTSDQIETKFKIIRKYYQFSTKTVEFLENHQVEINVGDPTILDHTKRLAKENIKQDVGFCSKQLCTNLGNIFFVNYYLLPEFNRDLSDAELQFIGIYLPQCLKCCSDQKTAYQFLLTRVKDALYTLIEPEIAEYSEQLYNYIFGKQVKQIAPPTIKDLQLLQKSYRSNLFYLMHKAEEQNQIKQVNLKYFCLALAYKDSAYLWNHFYLYIFEQAKSQFYQKTTSEIDWFLSQKKAQTLVNKNSQLSYLFEYRYIMDLLKAQQRQIEYQMSQSDKAFQKTQQIYEYLYKGKQFNIPDDALDLEYNFRVMIFYEKKVIRKYRNVTAVKIRQNIDNLLKLRHLIVQMKQYELDYFYQSKDGEFEIEQDIYINLYKFIRRFVKLNQYAELNEIMQIIKEKVPSLLQPCQLQYQFEFPIENRSYKFNNDEKQIQNGKQITYDKNELNLILNNILSYFLANICKFNKKKVLRYLIEAYYYATHLKFHSSASIDEIFAQIQIIFLPNSKDLVYYYMKIDKFQSEKDEVLQNYYYNDLVFSYQKSKILKLIIKILLIQQKFKDIYLLFEKLNKVYDLRLYQACMGLMEKYEQIEEKNLIRDIIYKIESYRRTNELFKQDNVQVSLNELYIKWYEKDQISQGLNEFQQESKEKRLEKGKKMMEDYKATKRKVTKPKPQIQQQQSASKQNQILVDDIEQYINKDPIQQFNDYDNL